MTRQHKDVMSEQDFVSRLNRLQLGKKYKSRKEVVIAMGLPPRKSKGGSGQKIKEYLNRYTEYEKDGWSIKFTKIKDVFLISNKNTISNLLGVGILSLLMNNYKKSDTLKNKYTVMTDISELLLDLYTCNDKFIEYKNKPHQLLKNNRNINIENVNTVYDYLDLTKRKLKRNLFYALDQLNNYGFLEYKEVNCLNYSVVFNVYNNPYNNTPIRVLKDIKTDKLQNELKNTVTKNYKEIPIDSCLPDIDYEYTIGVIKPFYITARNSVFDKYIKQYNINPDKYKKNNNDNINIYNNPLINQNLMMAIDKAQNFSQKGFFIEINNKLSKELTREFSSINPKIKSIHITKVKKLIEIDYNYEMVSWVLNNMEIDFQFEDINNMIVSQINSLSEDRHKNALDEYKDTNENRFEELQKKFRSIRLNKRYIKDCETLTELLIKIKQKHGKNT